MSNGVSRESVRLAPQQRRALSCLQELGTEVLRSELIAEIEGPLDDQVLETAIRLVTANHTAFSLVFEPLPGSGEMGMRVGASGPRSSRMEDQDDAPAEPFGEGLEEPRLIWCLRRTSHERHFLKLAASPLAADCRSLGQLLGDLRETYEALAAGRDPDLEPAVQYLDAAEILNELLEADELEPARAHWRSSLGTFGDVSPALHRASVLARDAGSEPRRPARPDAEFDPARYEVPLSPSLTSRLWTFAEQHRVSLATVLLAGWQSLLGRLHSDQTVTVGVATDGISHPMLANVCGPLSRCLPAHPRIVFDERVAHLLARVETEMKLLRRWQDAFEWDLVELNFLPWGFDYQELPPLAAMADLTWSIRHLEARYERFAVRLAVTRRADDGQLRLYLDHDASWFTRDETSRLGEELVTWLASLSQAAERPLATLDLLGPIERRQLTVELNRTERSQAPSGLAHQRFQEQAATTPDAVAMVFDSHHTTYRELDRVANQLARFLRHRGVGPDVPVGICLERAPALTMAVLGVLKAGGAYVPLDPTYPDERLAFMQRESGAALVLTQEDLVPAGGEHGAGAQLFCLDADRHEIAHYGRHALPRLAGPENLAYVIYTSGSTGRPKGTMITHGGLANYLAWCLESYDPRPAGCVPFFTPLGFDLTVTSFFPPLLVGGRLLLLSEDQGIGALAEALAVEREFDLVKLTPAHLELLNLDFEGRARLGNIRSLILGGETLYGESLALWRRRSPTTRMINEYGPTETVVGCSTWEIAAADARSGPLPIGSPVANTRLYLVGPTFEPLPVGVTGEILVGGRGVARGYLHLPALTAERFVPDPFASEPGTRLYRTGDLGRFHSDGYLEFLGRNDHQVKIRGFRVELGEIEAVLRARDEVRDAVVTVRDEPGGTGLAAYLVRSEPAAFEPAALLKALKLRLPDYMVPVYIIALDTLPLTANGKVDRRALPAPSGARGVAAARYVAPETQVQATLAEIWQEFLEADRVGLEDNFFDLGGHSLKASRVVARTRKHFPVEPTVADLFEHPTLGGFAQRLEGRLIERVSQLSDAEAAAFLEGVLP